MVATSRTAQYVMGIENFARQYTQEARQWAETATAQGKAWVLENAKTAQAAVTKDAQTAKLCLKNFWNGYCVSRLLFLHTGIYEGLLPLPSDFLKLVYTTIYAVVPGLAFQRNSAPDYPRDMFWASAKDCGHDLKTIAKGIVGFVSPLLLIVVQDKIHAWQAVKA